jgi:hypothetical protein
MPSEQPAVIGVCNTQQLSQRRLDKFHLLLEIQFGSPLGMKLLRIVVLYLQAHTFRQSGRFSFWPYAKLFSSVTMPGFFVIVSKMYAHRIIYQLGFIPKISSVAEALSSTHDTLYKNAFSASRLEFSN